MPFETYYKTGGLSKGLRPEHVHIVRAFLARPGCTSSVVFTRKPGPDQKAENALDELVRAGILVAHNPQFAITPRRVQQAKRDSRLLHKVKPVEELIGHLRTLTPHHETVFHIEPSLVEKAHAFVRSN